MSDSVSSDDNIVILIGPTGSGKSTFIDCATRQDGRTVGHNLRSFTSEIRTTRIRHPTNNRPVVFVDTPGFDDTTKSDMEILTMIADWHTRAYRGKVNLATIVYLHKISDNRMTGSLLKNLSMFSNMCGQKVMPRVVIATTMWGKVDEGEGIQREAELKGDFWKDILEHGCTTARFDRTHDCAWGIVGNLDEQERGTLPLFSPEIIENMRRNNIKAGITLSEELEKLLDNRKNIIRKLREPKKRDNVQQLNEEKKKIDQKIREVAEQLQTLKIPLTTKVLQFFNVSRFFK